MGNMLKKNELQNKVKESFNFQDPFRLEEQLTEEEIQIRNLAKSFAKKELLPNIVLQNRHEDYDKNLFKKFVKSKNGYLILLKEI